MITGCRSPWCRLPPGAGKTTLVTAALADHRGFVPLVVDRRHNEACRLAGVIADTLGVAVSGAQELPTVKGIQSAASLLDATFSQVERAGRRRVLALDDVQELASPDPLGTLAYLVERAPVGLDVVLCSRADPPIRLTRLRLDGRLREIRNDQLAFDHTEAAELLAAHGVRPTRGQMDAIWRRTQGWAAGLRLAACALQREADPRELVDSMAATESAIVDYLLEELLTRQDRGLQQFLLRTSVAGRLTADLAQSLAADALAADRLAELERQGVVVADLDDPTWYRYHPLFAALL